MQRTYLNAFQIGIVAGMRSMMAPALVSHIRVTTQPNRLPGSTLHLLTSPTAATFLKLLAGGELIGDKFPKAPNRIEFQPLLFRVVSGAVCGAALSEAKSKKGMAGAVLGGLGALAGTYAFFHLRRWLTHQKELPDPLVAVAEDAVAVGMGLLAVRQD